MSEARPTLAPAGLEKKSKITGGPPLAEAPLMTPEMVPVPTISKAFKLRF